MNLVLSLAQSRVINNEEKQVKGISRDFMHLGNSLPCDIFCK